MEGKYTPRPGSMFKDKATFLEQSKEVLGLMQEEAEKELGNGHTTQFSNSVHAPTVMVRAAVARTVSSQEGIIYIAYKAVHGWTVRSIKRIRG